MSVMTHVAPTPAVTTARVARSEWAKLWSLRSTWITLGVGLLFLVGFGAIGAVQLRGDDGAGPSGLADATGYSVALFGVTFAMIAFGVLGVLTASAEYTTGMVRATLAAVPRRLPVLWAKAMVYGAVAFAVGLAGAFVSVLVSSAVLAGTTHAVSLGDDGVLTGLLGAGAYLGLVGVIGVALGVLLRSTAGGISALVGTFLLVPGLMSLLPDSWSDTVTPYLPTNAGDSIYALTPSDGALTAGAGLLVLLGWAALALGGAAYRLKKADA